jgi:prepilin-type N-terminal cleavage/methylation domain-containing protein
MRYFRKQGFTIVELLIVIVVIGVLAAITVVAFNGVQRQARTTQQAQALDRYVKGFMLYTAHYGKYPYDTSRSNVVCIASGSKASSCADPITGVDAAHTQEVATKMREFMPAQPSFNAYATLNNFAVQGTSYAGVYFYVEFKDLITCPVIGSLSLINFTNTSVTACRYAPTMSEG